MSESLQGKTAVVPGGYGVLGAAILLGLYSVFWNGRLRGSVNQDIYDRQVKSI